MKTFAECQDLVERATKPPETSEEIMFALLTLDNTPSYLEGLRFFLEGIRCLETTFTPCTNDCSDGACIGKPAHQSHAYSTIHAPFVKVQEAVKELKEEMAHFLYKTLNCECEPCKHKRRVDAAHLN